jgi:hypothetical protein
MINTSLLSILFLISLAIALLLVLLNKKLIKTTRTQEKVKPYTGGETLNEEEIQARSENFYWAIKKSFKPFYKYLGEKHTGILSDYLAWALVALIIITLALIGAGL